MNSARISFSSGNTKSAILGTENLSVQEFAKRRFLSDAMQFIAQLQKNEK
jgi:hypothetical protein